MGKVSSCCVNHQYYGDCRVDSLSSIVNNEKHKKIKEDSLNGIQNPACLQCWETERDPSTADFSVRINALEHSEDWMNSKDAFKLEMLDLRWQNTCNLACIMCSPLYSSKWEKEIKGVRRFPFSLTDEMFDYIYKDLNCIKEVYLAGGEPLQMTENVNLLKHLLESNPGVRIRLNTNLAVIDTEVYRLLKEFPKENIQWNVSIDGELEMYNYVRYPGNWQQVYKNLIELTSCYDDVHCDILVNILNAENVLLLAENVLLEDLDLNPDHIKFTPLSHPVELDVRNYPEETLSKIMMKTAEFMASHVDEGHASTMIVSASRVLKHMNDKDFTKDLDKTREFLLKLDIRRNLDYKTLGTYLNE